MKNIEQLLIHIIRRQNAMIDMMSDFIKAYAKVNELPIEEVDDEINKVGDE